MNLTDAGLSSQTDTGTVENQCSSAGGAQQRILYAVGPGDVVGLYRDLLQGKQPSFQPGMPFSKQFIDWCDESGVQAHLVSWHRRRDFIQVGSSKLENRPKHSWYFKGGLRHHIGALMYGIVIVAQAIRNKSTLVIVDSGTTHWIVLSLLFMRRIPVVSVIHNTLWPMGFPPKGLLKRLFLSMDGLFFRRIAAATVCVSPECERQVIKVTGIPRGPIYQCRPQYRHGFLSRVNPVPDHDSRPFRILFLGRIEEAKGVFLILSMAELLENELPGQFAWKIVGSGSASEALKHEAVERKLSHIVEIPGMLRGEQDALETFGWAHAVVVPTSSQFCEGLAMAAAEGILAGRPVILSSVVPAWEVLGNAAIKAEADNVDSFVDAFRKLALDAAYYHECQCATLIVQEQFYEKSQGLGSVLGRAIAALPRLN